MGEEYRTISVIVIESFVYIFVFFPFISYYIDQTNMLYYYTKAILLYDFHHTLRNFYFRRVFVVSLISVNAVSIFALLIFAEVEPNTSDVFSRFYVRLIYRVPMFALLVTILVLAPLSSPIVGNYDDVVFCGFSDNEFNRFRFLFIRVRRFFYSEPNFFLVALSARLLILRAYRVVLIITHLEESL